MIKSKKLIINLLIQNETDVSRLYAMYSRKIENCRKFWNEIAQEEKEHVKILKDIKKDLRKGERAFADNDYSLDIVLYISTFIQKELEKAKNNIIQPMKAFETSLRLEQSMIENRCFDIFQPTKKEYKKTLQKINRDTKRHIRMVEKEIRKFLQEKPRILSN